VWRWDSDPFGNTYPTNPPGTGTFTYNLRFPGQQYDDGTGYYYNVLRDYNPITGRYLQADPIGLEGGMSRYGYVYGNPLSFVDPNGLTPKPEWWNKMWAAPDTSKCATAECAAGLLPAPSENRTQAQIDVGQCRIVCLLSLTPSVAACNAAAGGGLPGMVLGQKGKGELCTLVCGK
jgi:RHS repeat-associated protein